MTAPSEAQGLERVSTGRCAYCHGPIQRDGVRDGRHVVHTRHLESWQSWLQRPAGLR